MQRAQSTRMNIISQKREPDKSILESNLHDNYGKIHSVHFEKNQGVIEKGFGYDDGTSAGNFSEIMMDGINIFYTEQQAKRERIINVDFDFPVIQMFFLFKGDSAVSNFKEEKLIHSITANEHNLVYRPHFRGNYHLKTNHLKNFGIQLTEKFYNRLIDVNSKPLYNLAESIQKGEEHILMSKRNLPITPEMKSIIYDIMHCNRSGYMKRLFLESKIIELFLLQVEQAEYSINHNSISFKGEDIDKLNEAKLFIEKNMFEEFTLPELSLMVGINEFKLKKGFKELFGTTVFNYLNELKMGHAKRLLLDEKKNVFEVAAELGYSEPHHFTAAFKKKFGYTPKEIKS